MAKKINYIAFVFCSVMYPYLHLYPFHQHQQRKFIQSHGEKIDVEPMIHKYQRVFINIQDELHLRVLRTYVTEISKLVLEMEELYQKGLELKMMYNLPFRDRDIRYLKYIVNH